MRVSGQGLVVGENNWLPLLATCGEWLTATNTFLNAYVNDSLCRRFAWGPPLRISVPSTSAKAF